MKKESQNHISVVADNFVTALKDVSAGVRFYEVAGEKIMSIPMTNSQLVKKNIIKQLTKLVKNVTKIENK